MKSRRSHVQIIFADLSFLLISTLIAGYLFVEEKKPEPVKIEESAVLEKGIDLPRLPGEGSAQSNAGKDAIVIQILKEGGRFLVNNETVEKSEISRVLKGIRGKNVNLMIDKKAPSEDTLYLFSILDKDLLRVNILYISEE